MCKLQSTLPQQGPFQRFRARSLLLSVFLWQIVIFVGLLLCLILMGETYEDRHEWLFLSAHELLTYLTVSLLVWRQLHKIQFPMAAFFRAPSPNLVKNLAPLLPIWVLMMIGVAGLNNMFLADLEGHEALSGLLLDWAGPEQTRWWGFDNLWTALTAVIFAPFLEELVFRGILLHRLAYKWGAYQGAILSALSFGLMHGISAGHVYAGLLLTILYLRSRSLWLPIFAHMSYNLTYVLLSAAYANQLWGLQSGETLKYLFVLSLCLGLPLSLVWIRREWHHLYEWPPYLKPVSRNDSVRQ